MVKKMNFGGWEHQQQKEEAGPKSRKEVFQEIMEKSKAYKAVKHEIKLAHEDLREQLDSELFDLMPLLKMKKDAYGEQEVDQDKALLKLKEKKQEKISLSYE